MEDFGKWIDDEIEILMLATIFNVEITVLKANEAALCSLSEYKEHIEINEDGVSCRSNLKNKAFNF
jgi:hypothetical protein